MSKFYLFKVAIWKGTTKSTSNKYSFKGNFVIFAFRSFILWLKWSYISRSILKGNHIEIISFIFVFYIRAIYTLINNKTHYAPGPGPSTWPPSLLFSLTPYMAKTYNTVQGTGYQNLQNQKNRALAIFEKKLCYNL